VPLNRGNLRAHGRSAGLQPWQLRGLAVDAARLPEKPSYYRRLIDFCCEWDLNALLFRLADDQGSMLRFKNHSELITHQYALTPQEARDLAEYGERQGVTVIPEIESFGHTRYITAVPRYAYLLDSDPSVISFSGINPVHPDTLALISDLYREVAAVFPSRYLHGGCDEVNFGGSALTVSVLKTKSRAEIWAEYLNSLDEICHGLGKELIIWGDFVLHKEPDILPRLKKSVIVMDWQYIVTDPRPLGESAQRVVDQGLRVIGAPAITHCHWGPRVGTQQLRNIDAFVDAYAGIQDARCLGAIVTNWAPSRYIQGSIWDTFAYAAVSLNHGSRAAKQSAFQSFVKIFYNTEWNCTWREIFDRYYRIAPHRDLCPAPWQGPRLPVPWASEDEVRTVLSSGAAETFSCKDLCLWMRTVEDSVQRNRDDFSALALSAEYIDHIFWRRAVLIQARKEPSARAATDLIQTIADRDRTLVSKLEVQWDRGRFSEGKLESIFALWEADQLFFQMNQAAKFSSELALDGDRLSKLLG